MKRLLIVAGAVVTLLAGGAGVAYQQYRTADLFEILHLPDTYPHRTGDLSANVSGRTTYKYVDSIRYRINGGRWWTFDWNSPRVPMPVFTLEMPAAELVAGENRLEIEAHARYRPSQSKEFRFDYDPTPIALPLRIEWKDRQLEVQDGYWESVEIDGEWRVRPVPGYEGYDRILLATGGFRGGRRVRTEVVFRHTEPGWNEFVVGVLCMWAGHLDDWSRIPRRGWCFTMGCFWSKPNGAGAEISRCFGSEAPQWINSYRSTDFQADVPYVLLMEVRPVNDTEGRHICFQQLVKCWPKGQEEPEAWIEATDIEGAPLPDGEYAVALLLYRCQAEFGPLEIEPLPPLVESER